MLTRAFAAAETAFRNSGAIGLRVREIGLFGGADRVAAEQQAQRRLLEARDVENRGGGGCESDRGA